MGVNLTDILICIVLGIIFTPVVGVIIFIIMFLGSILAKKNII